LLCILNENKKKKRRLGNNEKLMQRGGRGFELDLGKLAFLCKISQKIQIKLVKNNCTVFLGKTKVGALLMTMFEQFLCTCHER